MNKIGVCLLQYDCSFKTENNCYSIYMNKTFYGHTPNVDGLFNLDRIDTHIHKLMPKDVKLIMIVQHTCSTAI